MSLQIVAFVSIQFENLFFTCFKNPSPGERRSNAQPVYRHRLALLIGTINERTKLRVAAQQWAPSDFAP
jgi:hypothetical protein